MKFPDFRTRMVKEVAADEWLFPNINNGCVCKFDDAGNVSESLWDSGGSSHPTITSDARRSRTLCTSAVCTTTASGASRSRGSMPAGTACESYWGKK